MSSIWVAIALVGGGFSESSADAMVLASCSSSLASAVVIGLILSWTYLAQSATSDYLLPAYLEFRKIVL